MSLIVREVNRFFSLADAAEIQALKARIVMTDRQAVIFDMFYIRKIAVDFIADELCVSPETIHKELRHIRDRITYFLQKV